MRKSSPHAFPVALISITISPLLFTACTEHGEMDRGPDALASEASALIPGSEVTLTVTVLENVLDCAVGAACYLRVRLDDAEARIVYHTPRGEACLNTEASAAGGAFKPGDMLEVHGLVTLDGEITTCPSESYYLRAAPDDAALDGNL